MLAKKALSAAPAAVAQYVEDVFSTYLYSGTGSAQTITNNIDLSGEGGMVWIKARNDADDHNIYDTVRLAQNSLSSNLTEGQTNRDQSLTSFNNNGFSLGTNTSDNGSTRTYAAWSFRKAEKFFDVVTYTGTGSARTVSHNLGSTPGCIIVKCTSQSENNWFVYHTSLGATKNLKLNLTNAEETSSSIWNNTAPTSTVFTVGSSVNTNESGQTYVAYLFAHDAGGFGEAGDQSVIKCGSMTANTAVDLGWEPQWVLVKTTASADNWRIYDQMTMNGFAGYGTNRIKLSPNLSSAEVDDGACEFTATGFKFESSGIYIAIRRGPMKTPEVGTEVFNPTYDSNLTTNEEITTNFPVDFVINARTGAEHRWVYDRARGADSSLKTSDTASAGAVSGFYFDSNTVLKSKADWSATAVYSFKRAPGFLDVVCYAGNSTAGRTITHNLGAAPELIFTKTRNGVQNWGALCTLSGGLQGRLNATDALTSPSASVWGNGSSYVAPTSTVFTVGNDNETNGSYTYVAYLFASVAGVSKIGTYTGNGSSQTINCGFTSGARFVLIKRSDSTSNWVVFDSSRGIVSGDDPFLPLNTTTAQTTNQDVIDPDNSGFIVNETTVALNTNAATYIFLAIA